MPVQFAPSSIGSAAAQAFKARLRTIYNSPSAPPATPTPTTPPAPISIPKGAAPPPTTVTVTPLPRGGPAPPISITGRVPPPLFPKTAPITPPPTTNPVPRIAPPSGGGAAAVVTTAGGVVTGAGLLTGGLSLLAGGLLIYNARELYKLFKLSQPEPKTIFQEPPEEGQEIGISYGFKTSSPFVTQTIDNPKLLIPPERLWGPVTQFNPIPYRGAFDDWYVTVRCAISKFDLTQITREVNCGLFSEPSPTIGNLEKFDDEPNTNPPPLKAPIPKRSPIKSGISPSPTPQSISSPNPTGGRSPTSPPPVTNPLPTNNRVPYTITTPGSAPITITSPGAAPVVISPTGTPATIKITRPSASPFFTPSPTTTPIATPITTPTGTPTTTPAGVPIAVSSPGSVATNLVMPGANPITINYPGQEPIVIDPVGTRPPQGVQATPIPKPGAFITTPASFTQTPTNPVTTPTKPGTPTTPTTPENPFADIKDPDLAKIGLGLVGITQLLQGLNTNTTPNAIANAITPAIAPAVCSTTKPGGCSSNMTNNAVSKGNEDLKQFLTNQLPNVLGSSANAAIGADTNTRVKNIENRTGSHRYPMTLPEYLLDDFIDKPVIIQDQVDFNVWLVKNVDALVGLFPIKIERTDENGVKQMLKFENIAEAIAELTGLLAEIAFDADTSVNVGVHATSEAIGAKVAAIQANSYLKAISDYLGYQGSHKSIDVPISCTPGAVGLDDKLQENELGDFLKSSTQRAIGWECTERDDLHSIIKRILFDSEVARAALYKPLKPPKPGVDQPVTGDAIKADRRKEKDKENDEWEKFKTRIKNQEGTGIDIDIDEKSLTDETP